MLINLILWLRNLLIALIGVSVSVVVFGDSVESNKTISMASIPAAQAAPSMMVPAAPAFDVKSYILIDANSGYIIAEKNAHEKLPPASLTKVMTLYLIANNLRSGRIHLNDQVLVSENAWRTGGSRMFIQVGTQVAVSDLIKGIAIASGNDATVAMAEHTAGSESTFVGLMNQQARELAMENTSYADSSGLPNDYNYSTASDLAKLAKAWIANFPEYYPWFGEKWINYNKIKQPNRNRLLWRDNTVDGLKTGHTDEAGYCLIASALRGQTRLIAVIMGAKSDATRATQSMALLNYGFRFFETRKLFTANTPVVKPKVLLGKDKYALLGFTHDLYVTVPIGQGKNVKVSASIAKKLQAPIEKGREYGLLTVTLDGKIVTTEKLIALQANKKANFIFAFFDYIKVWFVK